MVMGCFTISLEYQLVLLSAARFSQLSVEGIASGVSVDGKEDTEIRTRVYARLVRVLRVLHWVARQQTPEVEKTGVGFPATQYTSMGNWLAKRRTTLLAENPITLILVLR